MLSRYVNVTGDHAILSRALPLAEAELQWWSNNRTISVTSPYTNKTYQVSHYAVNNTAPRPESYLEDYETVNGSDLPTNYTDAEKAELYSELASGAETGWDYSSRWTKEPFATIGNTTNQEPLLRGLNVKGLVPVDLNSILCKYFRALSDRNAHCARPQIMLKSYWLTSTTFRTPRNLRKRRASFISPLPTPTALKPRSARPQF